MKGKAGKQTLWVMAAAVAVLLLLAVGKTDLQPSASQQEKRIAQVLSAIRGAGKVEVALFYAQETAAFSQSAVSVPTGAVVVAQGADDITVRLELIRAVRTLLSLPQNAVDVFVMEEE